MLFSLACLCDTDVSGSGVGGSEDARSGKFSRFADVKIPRKVELEKLSFSFIQLPILCGVS